MFKRASAFVRRVPCDLWSTQMFRTLGRLLQLSNITRYMMKGSDTSYVTELSRHAVERILEVVTEDVGFVNSLAVRICGDTFV